jgi:serine phosphatase RsbU (regulator of sigma subunit)/anti-anti-sigma regulatory factor
MGVLQSSLSLQPCVLLVEDDPAVLETYLRALRKYAPLHASDGVEACKILLETKVDVVLCDLQMPRMNGLDLMRWAKENCPHPLWIVVSGRGTLDAAAEALKLGAFDFVRKPVQSAVELQIVVANAGHRQALVAERELLLQSLADNNRKLTDSHGKIQAANAVLRDQQAMLDQDLKRAERILRALMPRKLRTLERMHVNVAYRPSESIGGDFYGAAMLDDRHLAVYVADVAGHGVSAALLAVLFDQRLAACCAEDGLRAPAAILSELNRGLMDECRASGLFVTVAYALIDTVERTATIASAGHPPGIVLRCTGTSLRLEKTGPALGLTQAASYGEHRISLEEGDRLLFFTDGLTGAMSERALELDSILATVAPGTESGARVVDRLVTWFERAVRADDDMTLLVLTASSGVSTFDDDEAGPPRDAPMGCALSVGSSEGTRWVVVTGQATWKDAAVLRATCMEALDAEHDVVIDLAPCTLLDSTVLGTMHELVTRAEPHRSLRVQGVSTPIRALFEELAMTKVLATITPSARPLPAGMVDLRPEGDAGQGLVLHAHELLAELSASNAEQFQPVVDALRQETTH